MRDKERLRAWKRKNYKKNRKKILEKQREYMKDYLPEYRKKNGKKLRKKDREYKMLHRKEINQKRKQRRKENPEASRASYKKYDLKRSGWTLEQFEEAFRLQAGKCWICGLKLVFSNKGKGCPVNSACADHDHETGKRRGLLCARCNRLEGMIQQLPVRPEEWLEKLHEYLGVFG